MSVHVDVPQSDELAKTLDKLDDSWSRERDWQPQLAGLFVETGEGRGRVYFSSEPGLFVEFALGDVERYDREATRVMLKPDSRVTFSFGWTYEQDAGNDDGDEFALQVQRSPEGPQITRLIFHMPIHSNFPLASADCPLPRK